MSGILPLAEGNEVIGSIPYISNTVTTRINGFEAHLAHTKFFQKRAKSKNCSRKKLATVKKALKKCVCLARRAEDAALSGPKDRMEEFFRSAMTTLVP